MGVTTAGLAEMMGVTTQTIRGWIRENRIPFHTGPTGRAFFTDDDLRKIIQTHESKNSISVHYARSSCGSKESFENQFALLKGEYGQPDVTIKDSGSGLKENRKGLNRILDMARAGQMTDLAITTQDRLTRFGYAYLKRYLEDYGVSIHVLQGKTEKHPEQELIDDFMALLASFSGRYYHLRSKANQRKFLEQIGNEAQGDE